MDHKEHCHFVLYKEGKIIGYAHIQYWPQQVAALRIIVIDEQERNQGYGAHLLKFCEQTLEREGIKVLKTESRADVIGFYKTQGYCEMPFDDPEGHPTHENDTALGKNLRDEG